MASNTTKVGQFFGKAPDPRTYASDGAWPMENCLMGIEVEIEGAHNARQVAAQVGAELIEFDRDGSLRGDNAELRFRYPLSGRDLSLGIEQLDAIFKAFTKLNGNEPELNQRTSMHVHMDVRNINSAELQRFVILCCMFDKVLFHYCSADREWNNFCLPVYRAEGLREPYSSFFRFTPDSDFAGDFVGEAVAGSSKYASINFAAIKEFGSVEFRHHQGTLDPAKIAEWVAIVQCLKAAALRLVFTSPQEFFSDVSRNGAKKVAEDVFGKYWLLLDYSDAEVDIMQGLRLAQDITLLPVLDLSHTSKEDLTNVEEAIAKANGK